MEKPEEQCSWGNLREKAWLRECLQKRTIPERIEFLHKYRNAIPLRQDWGTMCSQTMKAYTDRLLLQQGVMG